jgi:hypothetical protein
LGSGSGSLGSGSTSGSGSLGTGSSSNINRDKT